MKPSSKSPLLHHYYSRFLATEDAPAFIHAVTNKYTQATLERLAEYGPVLSRRAAMLAMGYVADYQANHVVGRALHDDDPGVRLAAENALRSIWLRTGDFSQRRILRAVVRLNGSGDHEEARKLVEELLEQAPQIAEAWNQRAIIHYTHGNFRSSVADCHQALELNPYHFPAAIGMANCFLELNDGFAALDCFRRALRIHPDLDAVQEQVDFLARALEEGT